MDFIKKPLELVENIPRDRFFAGHFWRTTLVLHKRELSTAFVIRVRLIRLHEKLEGTLT